MLKLFKDYFSFFQHNNWQWKLTLLGLVIFPLIPALGIGCLLIVVLNKLRPKLNFQQYWSTNNLLILLTLWLILSSIFAYKNGEAWL